MPSLTKEIPRQGELHKFVMRALSSRIDLAEKGFSSQRDKFVKAEDTVLAFVHESDMDKKRRSARESKGQPKYTTIKLPYTYALLMSAHTYLTSVFFSRAPIHQFAGRHGESEEQCDALEALIGYQVQVGMMLGPYYIWLYDSLKYGAGIIEEYWCEEEVQFTTLEEAPDPTNPDGPPIKQQTRVTMPGYAGNKISNVRPTDFLPDPRVPVNRFQDGEFVFVRKKLSWETIVKREKQGYYMNVDELKGANRSSNYFAAGQNQRVASNLETPEDNMTIVDTSLEGSEHPAVVYVYEGCCTIIPNEWKLGNSDFPEKWMFTMTQDKSIIIGAQPHGAMHCKFPYEVLESEIEGYGTWSRGLPDIVEPVQNTLDWLINQHFFNVRASLNNQFIIDPSKIVAKDAEDGGPGFVYRLRPEAYGTDVRNYFHQIPVQDMTKGHVGDMQVMLGIGERITGINDQIMGVLATGGRRTATEVRTSTGFGVNRMKTMGEYMSATGFSAHAQKLVQNTQQYYQDTKKFKIAGSMLTDMNPAAMKTFLEVNPETIQGFYDFVPVDGTLPVDRLALANLWKELLLQMRTVPGLIMQYDLSRIFAHVANLAGIRNLNQFKIEVGSPESLLQQADKGNVIPIRPGGEGNSNPAAVPGNNNAAGVPTTGVSPLG